MNNNLFQFSNNTSIPFFQGTGFITSTMNNTVPLNQINTQNAVKSRRRIKVQHDKSRVTRVIKLVEGGKIKDLKLLLMMLPRDNAAYVLTVMYTGIDHLFYNEIENFSKRYAQLKEWPKDHLIVAIEEKMPSLTRYLEAGLEVLP